MPRWARGEGLSMKNMGSTKRVRDLAFSAYRFQSFDRAMAIVKLLANAGAPLTLGDIAVTAGFKHSSTHRYLLTLLRHGLVLRTVKGRYLCAEQLVGLLRSDQALTTDN